MCQFDMYIFTTSYEIRITLPENGNCGRDICFCMKNNLIDIYQGAFHAKLAMFHYLHYSVVTNFK